jgi:hypothetical protein
MFIKRSDVFAKKTYLYWLQRSDAFAKRVIFNWYNGAIHSPRRLPFSGTTGRTIRQEDYLLNDTRERIIR